MARPRGKKRTAAAAAAAAEGSSKPEAATRGRGKRVQAPPKPKPETEYFPDKRNLEDLWLLAFPIGTEWENIDKIKEFNWNFENLEKALEEGGELYRKTVYLFGSMSVGLVVYDSTISSGATVEYMARHYMTECKFFLTSDSSCSSGEAGPNVIESEEHVLKMAKHIKGITTKLGLPLVFKCSFDKANRTSSKSFCGPGLQEGLKNADASIRKRARELVFLLANYTDGKPLIKEFVDCLVVADPDFKKDLAAKIYSTVEKFSQEKLWHLDHMFKVLSLAIPAW